MSAISDLRTARASASRFIWFMRNIDNMRIRSLIGQCSFDLRYHAASNAVVAEKYGWGINNHSDSSTEIIPISDFPEWLIKNSCDGSVVIYTCHLENGACVAFTTGSPLSDDMATRVVSVTEEVVGYPEHRNLTRKFTGPEIDTLNATKSFNCLDNFDVTNDVWTHAVPRHSVKEKKDTDIEASAIVYYSGWYFVKIDDAETEVLLYLKHPSTYKRPHVPSTKKENK